MDLEYLSSWLTGPVLTGGWPCETSPSRDQQLDSSKTWLPAASHLPSPLPLLFPGGCHLTGHRLVTSCYMTDQREGLQETWWPFMSTNFVRSIWKSVFGRRHMQTAVSHTSACLERWAQGTNLYWTHGSHQRKISKNYVGEYLLSVFTSNVFSNAFSFKHWLWAAGKWVIAVFTNRPWSLVSFQ